MSTGQKRLLLPVNICYSKFHLLLCGFITIIYHRPILNKEKKMKSTHLLVGKIGVMVKHLGGSDFFGCWWVVALSIKAHIFITV